MNSLNSTFTFLAVFLVFATAKAAPHPATATSVLVAPEKGLYFLHKGFSVKTEGTDWVPVANNNESLLDVVRFGPKTASAGSTAATLPTGSLSVRTDKIAKNVSLETYAKKFMRDYPNYGFDVLGSKTILVNQSPGLVVDMVQKTKNKQLRQVILKKDDSVAILTCMDQKDVFLKTIASCNQIIKSFQWTDEGKPADKATAKAPETRSVR